MIRLAGWGEIPKTQMSSVLLSHISKEQEGRLNVGVGGIVDVAGIKVEVGDAAASVGSGRAGVMVSEEIGARMSLVGEITAVCMSVGSGDLIEKTPSIPFEARPARQSKVSTNPPINRPTSQFFNTLGLVVADKFSVIVLFLSGSLLRVAPVCPSLSNNPVKARITSFMF